MMSMILSDIAVLNILKIIIISCVISLISKNEAINVMQITDLTKKVEYYKTQKLFITYKNG